MDTKRTVSIKTRINHRLAVLWVLGNTIILKISYQLDYKIVGKKKKIIINKTNQWDCRNRTAPCVPCARHESTCGGGSSPSGDDICNQTPECWPRSGLSIPTMYQQMIKTVNTKLVYHTKASISGQVLLYKPLQKISYLPVSLNIYLIFLDIEGKAQPAITGDVLHLNIKFHLFLPADVAVVNNGIFCVLQSESLWAMKQPHKQPHLYEKVKIYHSVISSAVHC